MLSWGGISRGKWLFVEFDTQGQTIDFTYRALSGQIDGSDAWYRDTGFWDKFLHSVQTMAAT
jgi:hypothetical protein